jgi:hypothetical protein
MPQHCKEGPLLPHLERPFHLSRQVAVSPPEPPLPLALALALRPPRHGQARMPRTLGTMGVGVAVALG